MGITFKLGDKIKVVSIPQSVYDMPKDLKEGEGGTLTAFQYLLDRNEAHTVVEVDTYSGWPWIKFQMLDSDDQISYHKLMLEPECVQLVNE